MLDGEHWLFNIFSSKVHAFFWPYIYSTEVVSVFVFVTRLSDVPSTWLVVKKAMVFPSLRIFYRRHSPPSLRLSAWNTSKPVRIFMNFCIGYFRRVRFYRCWFKSGKHCEGITSCTSRHYLMHFLHTYLRRVFQVNKEERRPCVNFRTCVELLNNLTLFWKQPSASSHGTRAKTLYCS
jgi:hypothetical protein